MFKIIRYVLKLFIKTQPIFFPFMFIFGMVHISMRVLATLLTQYFFDSVGDVITNGQPLRRAYLMIILAGLIFIVRELIECIYNFLYSTVLFHKPELEIKKIIHSKIARIDPICYEDPVFHDSIEKADSGADSIRGIGAYIVVLLAIYIPYLVFMGIYLHNLQPQLIWIIALAFVPTLINQLVKTGITAKFEDETAPIKREYNYFEKTITDRTYFKETRKLGAYKYFLTKLLNSMGDLGKAEWNRSKRIDLIELATGFVTAGGYVGVFLMLMTALLSGTITAGAFVAVLASIGMVFGFMGDMINEGIGEFAVDIGKAQNFMHFMELPERGGSDATPDFGRGIIAEQVDFSYPNAKQKSIDSLSLEIKAGETIAVVGANGAGKTTLIRLLIGLYIPNSGIVKINGMDTASINSKSLYKNVSGVFQHFQQYQMILDENIRISDLSSNNDTDPVLSESGVDFGNEDTFPNGKNTMLSREFGGVDLSGGQWQRIAIARGLYRTHNVIVLDEPTAAIDPIEERRVYRKFIEISKGKTAIIVTHRLGSTKIADRVIVMDRGKIVDIGSHNELLHRSELYAGMYKSQAVWYDSRN